MERILPLWPATAAALKPGRSVVAISAVGLAERVHGRQPAGAEHQGDVVALDAGQLGELAAAAAAASYGLGAACEQSRRERIAGPSSVLRGPVERQARRRRAAT